MAPDPCLYLRGLLLRGWRETGEGEEKVKGRGGGRDLAHPKILAWRPLWPMSLIFLKTLVSKPLCLLYYTVFIFVQAFLVYVNFTRLVLISVYILGKVKQQELSVSAL